MLVLVLLHAGSQQCFGSQRVSLAARHLHMWVQVELCSSKVVGAQQRMFEETEKLDGLRQEHAMLKMKYAELQSDYEAAVANRRRQ